MNLAVSDLHPLSDSAAAERRLPIVAERPGPRRRQRGRLGRQLTALLWILLAWGAGTIVFELTAVGGEADYTKFEPREDAFLGLFSQPPISDTAGRTDLESANF